MGGDMTANVERYQKNNGPLIPVTIDTGTMVLFYQDKKTIELDSTRHPRGWTNFYRSDDVSATAYFYLDKPADELPALQNASLRNCNLRMGQVPKPK
jgi:hypothetical protein